MALSGKSLWHSYFGMKGVTDSLLESAASVAFLPLISEWFIAERSALFFANIASAKKF